MSDTVIKNFPDDFTEVSAIQSTDKIFVNSDNYITGQNFNGQITSNLVGLATTSTNPATPTSVVRYDVNPSTSSQVFTNFKDSTGTAITVPANTNGYFLWNTAGYWSFVPLAISSNILQKTDIDQTVVGTPVFNLFVANGGTDVTGTTPNSGFINTSGGITANTGFVNSPKYAISVGDVINYTVRAGDSTVVMIGLYNSAGVFLSAILTGSSSTINTLVTGSFTATAAGYIAYCTGLQANGGNLSSFKITRKQFYATPTQLTAVKTTADTTSATLTDFIGNGGGTSTLTATTAGYLNTSGAIVANSGFVNYPKTKMSKGDSISYSLRMGNSLVGNIVQYNSDGTFLKVLLAGTDATVNNVVNGSLTFDADGYFAFCNGLQANGLNPYYVILSRKQYFATPTQMSAATARIATLEQNSDTVAVSNELMMPAKIWVINEYPLTFYKSSITRDLVNMKNKELIVACQDANDDGNYNYPIYKSVVNDFQIDATKVLTNFLLFIKNYKLTLNDYAVSVVVSKIAKNAKDGQSLVWSCIGDSLTNRGTAYYTLKYLAAIGSTVNITNVGTMGNLGSKNGEGKEGWTTGNFIGADNIQHFGVGTITRPADNATTSSTSLNPFLKLATDTDKANNPTFCFRNTGSATELNYSTDTDKTGNFYIFDYAWYLSARGLTTPTFVTIALGTNDFTVSGATGVTNAIPNLIFMVKQIRAALPTAKIGLISATGQGNNSTNLDYVFNFVNQLNTAVTNLGDANVSIIGSFASMNRNFMFPYGTTSNLQTDGNQTKVYPKSEFIHFTVDGYKEYAKTIAPWILSL